MKVRRWLDYGVDIASIAIAAGVGIIVIGMALDSSPVRKLEGVPLAGPVLGGARTLWQRVYDPSAN